MNILCKLFDHRQGVQSWSTIEEREADGVWMRLRTFCRRCHQQVDAGVLFVDAQETRRVQRRLTTHPAHRGIP